MKKKHIALLLTILIFGVSGCANKEPVETISTIDEVVEVESSEIIESTEIESSEVIESTEITSEVEITTEETTTIEENTEIEETEPPTVAEVETIEFEPYVMFTNTACNVRSQPTKDSDLLMTLDKNVGVTVYGEENGWSKVDIGSVFAYIKSSLLSKEQTADPAPAPSTQTAPTQPQSQPAQTQTQPAQPTASTQNTNGTISAYDSERGLSLTLTPNGKGWYTDQYGFDRDANGNVVSSIDGSLYQELPTEGTLHTVDKEFLHGLGFSTN